MFRELVAQLGANFVIVLPTWPFAAAKPVKSGTVSMSQTMTLLILAPAVPLFVFPYC
jgi:hypothetical protein